MRSGYFPFPPLGSGHFKLVKENNSETVYSLSVTVNKKTEQNLAVVLAEKLNLSSLVPLGVTLVGLRISGKF